jgi:hypothetical protein
MAVSPGGGRVFVTGYNSGHYGTMAYRADNGRQLWAARYDGPGKASDTAYSIPASPTQRKVFVTGESAGADWSSQYTTLAYDAATGKQLWGMRYGIDGAHSVAVSPGGGRVFVTGGAAGPRLWATNITPRWPTGPTPAGGCGSPATTAPSAWTTRPRRWSPAPPSARCSSPVLARTRC